MLPLTYANKNDLGKKRGGQFHIRNFTPNDYAAISALNNIFWAEEQLTAAQWQEDDAQRAPHCQHARWVAECDGQVVGMGEYDQLAGRYHPDKYWLRVEVLPAYQQRGIGAALYAQVLAAIVAREPMLVRFALRETMPDGIRFLAQRGFIEDWRSFPMRLDLTAFEPSRFEGYAEKLRARGIVIKSYAELAVDPARDRKLYELHEDTRQDTTFNEPLTRVEFDYWHAMFITGHTANTDSIFVAVRADEYLGYSGLSAAAPGALIETRWTGVRRAERRQGVALALKLRTLEYAKSHGHPCLETVTNSLNVPVLTMNDRLGYVREPAWVYYVKHFKPA